MRQFPVRRSVVLIQRSVHLINQTEITVYPRLRNFTCYHGFSEGAVGLAAMLAITETALPQKILELLETVGNLLALQMP